VLVIYICLLNWKYAELVREVTGGHALSMNDWSRMHLQISSLTAIACGSVFALEAVQWLLALAWR
jgi:hypothetical protein